MAGSFRRVVAVLLSFVLCYQSVVNILLAFPLSQRDSQQRMSVRRDFFTTGLLLLSFYTSNISEAVSRRTTKAFFRPIDSVCSFLPNDNYLLNMEYEQSYRECREIFAREIRVYARGESCKERNRRRNERKGSVFFGERDVRDFFPGELSNLSISKLEIYLFRIP